MSIKTQFYLLSKNFAGKLFKTVAPKVFTPGELDIHLISYPRSGSTWMRAIFAELLYGTSGASLKDLDYYIPDVHTNNFQHEVVPAKFHVVKSHFPYLISTDNLSTLELMKYKKVIYLIRDPRDVVISYYRYLNARGYKKEFNLFFDDWLNGRIWPTSWREHVTCWTSSVEQKMDFDLHIVRYEDLLRDPLNQMYQTCNFAGLEFDQITIQRALNASSVEKMRTKEKRGLRKEEDVLGMKFIGRAKSEQWKQLLSQKQVHLIEEFANREMKLFGYL